MASVTWHDHRRDAIRGGCSPVMIFPLVPRDRGITESHGGAKHDADANTKVNDLRCHHSTQTLLGVEERTDFTQRSEIAFVRGALKGVPTCSIPRCCKRHSTPTP